MPLPGMQVAMPIAHAHSAVIIQVENVSGRGYWDDKGKDERASQVFTTGVLLLEALRQMSLGGEPMAW
jgi:hypothetical protein